ncbi:hypothetical protein FT643_22605 [Ketobacter sp. MCCC 1A13808]|uniref:hypothetical protein n=1 Tax=Ketobacter sp. MCCC 1A13808 TaxID=2602738 RepID=UPI0012EC0CA1|nr:hypothetical protein [Ketobacter sp. MCCC 1A13808]MVF14929.1 hypothetical protein [Ketobacter sp. MCCC 1A13808]
MKPELQGARPSAMDAAVEHTDCHSKNTQVVVATESSTTRNHHDTTKLNEFTARLQNRAS